MARDPEALYLQLGQLLAEMPDFAAEGPITDAMHRWLARALILVEATTSPLDSDRTELKSAIKGLFATPRTYQAFQITAVLHRALAHAEVEAPAAARGAFVAVGAAFDALKAVADVLSGARQTVLIVDPYMDAKVLTDFAPLAPESVQVRLLSDPFSTKGAALLPSAQRWAQQFGAVRPLEVRLTAPRALHDRLICVDGALVWTRTQSLKDFAGRSPALVQRVDADLAAMKAAFYEHTWAGASPLA